MTEAGYTPANRLTLLRNGAEFFPALEAAIDAAKAEVQLETYIFANDETARGIAHALMRAARRGVAVQLLIDGFGSKDLDPVLISLLKRAGVQFAWFRPEFSTFNFSRHRLRRLHRKLCQVDGLVGFVGGINIIDDLHTPKHTPPRMDFAIRVEGPVVAEIVAATRRLWSLVQLTHFRRSWEGLWPTADVPRPPPAGNQWARLVIRDNLRNRSNIERSYLAGIRSAQKEILIANAYFFPGHRFRTALIEAAQRGVRVVLVLQGRVEYALLHYATRALYGPLLDAGIEIHEYHKSFLHAKVAVIDDDWATVGSSNIDPFSLLLAREANIFVKDGKFATELRQSLTEMIGDGCRQVVPAEATRPPLWNRMRIATAYWFFRVALGVLGLPAPDSTDQ